MSSPLCISKLVFLSFFVLYITLVDAAPMNEHLLLRDAGNASTTDFQRQNGLDAQKLNAQFASMSALDPCQNGSMACVNSSFAQCIGGKWTLTPCSSGLQCYALPLVKSPGTSLACDTQQDALTRIAASGVSGGLTGSFTTNGTVTDTDVDGDGVDDPPQSHPTSGNLTYATNGTPHNGSATDSGADDCADGDMTSSTHAMATPTTSLGSKQLYRRQTTLSSLVPTQTPVLTANQASVTTVTIIMVSTVTVVPSGCQTGVTTGLPSGSPTPLSTNSPTSTFTPSTSPSHNSPTSTFTPSPSSSGILTTSPSPNSVISPPASNASSTSTATSSSTSTQGGIIFSTQNDFGPLPTPA